MRKIRLHIAKYQRGRNQRICISLHLKPQFISPNGVVKTKVSEREIEREGGERERERERKRERERERDGGLNEKFHKVYVHNYVCVWEKRGKKKGGGG